MKRRDLLVKATTAAVGAGGVILGTPMVITALSPVLTPRAESLWISLGSPDQFEIGKTVQAVAHVPREDWANSLRDKGVYVWRQSADKFVVFSRSCTDLGCPVNWDPGSACFFCPCHGGIFSREGERMAGPPKRPLYRFDNRVQNGILEIDVRSVPPIA